MYKAIKYDVINFYTGLLKLLETSKQMAPNMAPILGTGDFDEITFIKILNTQ